MEKPVNNKRTLRVKRDKFNQWFLFGSGNIRIQLAGDPSKDGYWLSQYAKKALGVEGEAKFFRDFTEILKLMAVDTAPIFSLYEGEDRRKENLHGNQTPQAGKITDDTRST